MIPIGEYMPDLAEFENPGTRMVKNLLPGPGLYYPVPAHTVFSAALAAAPIGAIAVTDKDRNVYNYAATATKTYLLADTAWADKTRSGDDYATAAGERVEFLKWGEKVISTNFTDEIQVSTAGAANFADLAGSPPNARHIARVRDFVVIGNLSVSATNHPELVKWSGINDETDWTPSANTQSDQQELLGGGQIQKITGGEYGVILQEYSIWRMTYSGPPTIFQMDEVQPGRGCMAPGSVAQNGDMVFYLGFDGFYIISNGSEVVPIGYGKVDRTILADLDTAYISRISAAVAPKRQLYVMAYPGSGHTNGRPNKLAVYDWKIQRWSLIEFDAELLYTAAAQGYTLEGLDSVSGSIDALAQSLDSSVWSGGSLELGAFDSAYKMGFFNGSPMTALADTTEANIVPGQRAFVNSVRPVVGGGTTTVQLGTRNTQTATISYTGAVSTNTEGNCRFRSNARYHRARLNISGDFTSVQGVDEVRAQPMGNR